MALSGAEKTRRWAETIIDKTCVECGAAFRAMRRLKSLCSPGCKAISRSRGRPPTFKNCEKCGKRFGPVGYLSAMFCGSKCRVPRRESDGVEFPYRVEAVKC